MTIRPESQGPAAAASTPRSRTLRQASLDFRDADPPRGGQAAARKRTWLYYVGPEPPALDWSDPVGEAVIGGGINSGECVGRRKIEKREASATPEAFRDLLVGLARAAEGFVQTVEAFRYMESVGSIRRV